MPDGNICRDVNGEEYEIPISYRVEEVYFGSEDVDDPSTCTISEMVGVTADIFDRENKLVFKQGQLIALTDDERYNFEEDELNERRG